VFGVIVHAPRIRCTYASLLRPILILRYLTPAAARPAHRGDDDRDALVPVSEDVVRLRVAPRGVVREIFVLETEGRSVRSDVGVELKGVS